MLNYVALFIDDAVKIMDKSVRRFPTVSTRFHPGILLQHHFMKEQTNDLMSRIDSLQEQSQGQSELFQKQLAGYFETIANYDKNKAKADHAGARDVWRKQEKAVEDLQVLIFIKK